MRGYPQRLTLRQFANAVIPKQMEKPERLMLRYGCAAPLVSRQQPLDDKIIKRAAHRTLADTKLFGQLYLARQQLSGTPMIRRQSREQGFLDFLV